MDHIASIVDAKFLVEFDVEKRKEILDKYKVPKNCTSLITPKVNLEIWTKVPPFARRNDVRASFQQDTLLRITGAITSSIEDLLKARKQQHISDYKTIIAKLFDAIVMLVYVNREFSFKDKEALKPNLSHEFKQVCSRNLKLGKFFFGDDLPDTSKAFRTTSEIVSSAMKASEPSQSVRQSRSLMGYQPTHQKPFLWCDCT